MMPITFTAVLRLDDAALAALAAQAPACGTCPVALYCAAAMPVITYQFPCCGAIALDTRHGPCVLDCANHDFQTIPASVKDLCPLCSGDIIEAELRATLGGKAQPRYLRTVHAIVPLAQRLATWRRREVQAHAKIKHEALLLQELNDTH